MSAFLLMLALALPAHAEVVDHVALAALMVKDGHWDRAQATLAEVDPTQEGLDLERFHAVRGLVRLHDGDAHGAATDFTVSETLPSTWLPMAQALLQLGLFQEAERYGRKHLEHAPSANATLALAEALRGAGAVGEAVLLLEEGRLRYPEEPELTVRLAALHLAGGRPLAAGELLQRVAEVQPARAALAADCYLKAGAYERALYMNAMVPDPRRKATQRLSILAEQGRWEEAAALAPRLTRLEATQDDEIAYALGYAFFQIGAYGEAERALASIADPALFRNANQLRNAMEGR